MGNIIGGFNGIGGNADVKPGEGGPFAGMKIRHANHGGNVFIVGGQAGRRSYMFSEIIADIACGGRQSKRQQGKKRKNSFHK